MADRGLKLTQASAVLGIRPKDLQNFVQAGVLPPRRSGALYYFDTEALVSATVALYLKDSLGASTRYLTKFTRAVSKVPDGTGSGGNRGRAASRNSHPTRRSGGKSERATATSRAGEGLPTRPQAGRVESEIARGSKGRRSRPRWYVLGEDRQDSEGLSSGPQEAGAHGGRRSGGSNRLEARGPILGMRTTVRPMHMPLGSEPLDEP
jgi:hypothetical protein